MGRSFYRPARSNQIENYTAGNPYYHQASDIWYRMEIRGAEYFQSQYQIGFDGKQTNIVEKRIDYIVGSGNHSRTYLHRTAQNTLIELPLAWYAEKGGYWAMNPGYDKPDHEGFRRRIQYDCMFCHNSYPDVSATAPFSTEAVFPPRLPEGIDCQRCHGPGRAHVESTQKRGNIVNPAKLSPERQAEVCMQCHLETTSFPLPGALIRDGREPFSYRPGEPLAGFKLFFDHAPGRVRDEKFEIAGAAYQLNRSACLLKTGGKLTCTTCHNPHDVRHGAEASEHYNAVCNDCHAALPKHADSADCTGCHMPKRRTDDVVHVVMTDHHIQRRRPAGDLLADLAERHEGGAASYRGEVVAYGPGDELSLAVAQVVEGSNAEAGIPRLQAAIRAYRPQRAEPYLQLADALRNAGRCGEAAPVYEETLRLSPGAMRVAQKMALCLSDLGQHARAVNVLKPVLDKDPENANAWIQLGLALIGTGKQEDGVTALRRALEADPELPEAWNALGGVRMQAGDLAQAEPALRNAIRLQPTYAVARNNLANLLAASKRPDEAWYQFEMALKYKPAYQFARFSYGLALGAAGRLREAQTQFETVLRADPNAAESHEALGRVLMAEGQDANAIAHYREAVRIRPDFSRGNLSLGAALAGAGRTQEAVPYLEKAALSTDPEIRKGAEGLLRRYGAR
jgi:tetratricopeptide (TPR) repeat protein